MNINLSLSPATTIINKIVVVIFKASAPNAPVDHQEFDPPHDNPRNISFTDVDPGTYIVNTYETTGYPTLGTLRHSFIYDPSYTQVGIRPTEFLYMTGGATGYTDATWADWEIESIERVGTGTQYPATDVSYFITGNGYRRDGFDLTDPADEFTDNEKFVIRFYPNIVIAPPVIQSARIFTGVENITTDTLIDETLKGKFLFVNSSDLVVMLTFKAIASLGSFDIYGIKSNGGNQVRVGIVSEGGADIFQHNGSTTDEINLGQGETLWLLSDPTNKWIVIQASEGITLAGQFADAYSKDLYENFMLADGSDLNKTTYRRLWLAAQAMPSGTIVSEATWNSVGDGANNKAFFADISATTFRIPRIYAVGILKPVDGVTRLAGSYEADAIKAHNHGIATTNGSPSPNDTGDPIRGTIAGAPNTRGSEGSGDRTIKSSGGAENLIRTAGAFKLIRF